MRGSFYPCYGMDMNNEIEVFSIDGPIVSDHPDGTLNPYAGQSLTQLEAVMQSEEYLRPDPTVTGPCALKLSFACTGAGYERYDPRDMLKPETSFRTPVIMCLECAEMAADHYVRELHS